MLHEVKTNYVYAGGQKGESLISWEYLEVMTRQVQNTIIIIRDYVLAKIPFSSIAIFIFDLLYCFCNLIVKFTDSPFIFDDFAFLILSV